METTRRANKRINEEEIQKNSKKQKRKLKNKLVLGINPCLPSSESDLRALKGTI